MSQLFLWPAFIWCTLVILYSGTKLTKYADIIAEKTGLGRLWIGVLLLAFITSIPELITGLSSVLIFATPDIAAGAVVGSCVFNMLILAVLDIFDRSSPLSSRVHQRHTLSACFGIILLSIVAVNLFISDSQSLIINSFGWIGLYTPTIIFFYIVSMRLIFSHEKRTISSSNKEETEELKYESISTKDLYINFSINALLIVVAAIILPEIGKLIAEITGLGETFVGNILIALATSLPEVIVSVAALKIGAVDMAIGNLFGSNIFNVGILAIDDIFFTKGPILTYIGNNHIVSALSAIIMMAIAVTGLTYRARRKKLFIAWDSLCIAAVYVLNLIALYMLK